MRLYFFPAFIPLAAVLPSLLALASLLFAALQAARKHWMRSLLGLTICLLALGSTLYVRSGKTTAALPSMSELEKLPPQDPASERWHQYLPRAPLSNLAYSPEHELLLFGTRHYTVDAISTFDGTLRFSLQLNEPVLAAPLTIGNMAYLGEGLHDATRARIVAIRLPEGHPVWQHNFGGHIESAPRAEGDSLFGCAGEDGVFSLDRYDGSLRWHLKIGHCDTTPLITADALYALVGARPTHSELVAIGKAKGNLLWKVQLPGQPWGTIAQDPTSGNLVTTTGIGQLDPRPAENEKGWAHAVDPKTRQPVWTFELGGMPLLQGELIPASSSAIFALKKGELIALHLTDGKVRWKHALSSLIFSAPTRLPDNSIAALAIDGTLLELDSNSGAILRTSRLGEESTSSPIISKNSIFFATRGEIWKLPIARGGRIQ